jgi:dihydroneopterin aldolase
MTDTIRLEGLRAVAFHGVYEHERRAGQLFLVDVAVSVDLRPAAADDRLDRTIHYGELAERVVAAVERDPVDLIETVAERVAELVLSYPAALAVEVTVHKPNAPIPVPFADVSVTIRRQRS